MNRRWRPISNRVVRWRKPFAERFAAAAAVYGPELMLLVMATPAAEEEPPSRNSDGG